MIERRIKKTAGMNYQIGGHSFWLGLPMPYHALFRLFALQTDCLICQHKDRHEFHGLGQCILIEFAHPVGGKVGVLPNIRQWS
jgi:hypothetical protein